LCIGYLLAHTAVHHKRPTADVPWRARLRDALDGRAIWLATSVSLMAIALLATLSRSGITSLAVSVVLGGYLYGRSRPRAGGFPTWVLALCAAGLVLAVAKIDPILLGQRFAAARTSAADRFVIWRETLPIIRDFWLTGTGAGTYETAMLVYQRSSPGVRFNQAHNQYLQVVAEGGALVALPAMLALGMFVAAAVRKLRADMSGMYWIRAGAVCGLAGVAAQSVWDTGLTAPANAFLAAITAAIVVHRHEIRPESRA
jgi:O-antigen ligase